MPYTPSGAAERTALAWQRSALALAVVAALLLHHGGWAATAAAAAMVGGAVLAARRQLGCRALALLTVGAALVSVALALTSV
jgi:uncharacterized membrane protein YidH (DUF202 family)